MSFFRELRRRNVIRVGLAYILIAWVLLQVVDFALDMINAPNWVMQVFFLTAVIGLPVVVIFSWVFEMTPEGIRRESEIDRDQSITYSTGRKLDRIVIVFLAVAVVFLLAERYGTVEPTAEPETEQINNEATAPAPADTPRTPSVAVLPFINMSDDAQNEYFSDGISEELLNVLVRIEGLRVPSRTSSFTFKGSGKNVSEIGKELQVDHVLEGSVRKAGDRIRVTAQLIDVHTDTHLWSETYTRELDDIFAVQDEIAQAIVSALKITLSGKDQQVLASHATDNIEAYNEYLLGRHFWNQRGPSLLTAVEHLQKAVDMDPGFHPAWAALADAFVLIPEYRLGSVKEYIPKARAAASKALDMAPDSARALTTRAYIKAMYDYDLIGAEADYRRALELEPGYPTAHQWLGELLAAQRKTDAAMRELDIAAQLDPLAPIIPHVRGWILTFAGQPEQALEHYKKALELNPGMFPTLHNLVYTNMLLGRFDEARSRQAEFSALTGGGPAPILIVINAMENPAMKDKALAVLASYQDGALDNALFYAFLGEFELAMDSLEKGFAAGDPYAIHTNRMVIYDPLRDNPRFQAYLAKMNLWP